MNLFKHHRLSISTKVALSFILVVVLQGTLTQLGMSVLISESNSINFEKQMVQRVESNEAFIAQSLADLNNKANLLAGQQNIVSYTQFRLVNLLNRELSLFTAPLGLGGIYVFTEDGILIGSDGSFLQPDPNLRDLVRNTYRQGRQSFVTDTPFGIHLWYLSQIVSNDRVIGILGTRIAIDSLFMDRIEQISGARAALRYSNQVVYSTTFPTSEQQEVMEIPYDLPKGSIQGRGSYLYGALPLDEYGFSQSSLITILDMEESRRLIGQYNIFSVLFTLVVLIFASIISILFYRHSFLKPYTMLQEGVSRIGDGDFSYPIHHQSADEFGALVDSVDRMRVSLLNRDKELKALVNYNELILNNVRSGILTITEGGMINTWNSAARKMVHFDDDILKPLPMPLTEAELPDEVLRVIREGLETGKHVALRECRSVFRGKVEIFSVSTSPFSDGLGENLGMIAVIADITQMKKLEEQLHISQRLAAIGEMVAGVAHQLRNPMAIMKVSAEMLRDNFQNGEQYNQLASMLVSEIDTLNYVIDNFLDFARPIHTNLNPCTIDTLIRDSLALLPLNQFADTKITIRIDDKTKPALLDKGLMEQVVSNIILNALEASEEVPPPREVLVQARTSSKGLEIVIQDWGCGMEQDIIENIFNPFYTNKAIGTGLGLSIVHRIIEEHNGSIDVKSAPGKGSTFTIII